MQHTINLTEEQEKGLLLRIGKGDNTPEQEIEVIVSNVLIGWIEQAKAEENKYLALAVKSDATILNQVQPIADNIKAAEIIAKEPK